MKENPNGQVKTDDLRNIKEKLSAEKLQTKGALAYRLFNNLCSRVMSLFYLYKPLPVWDINAELAKKIQGECAKQLMDVTRNTDLLLKEGMSGKEKAGVKKAVEKVPSEEREEVCRLVASLTRGHVSKSMISQLLGDHKYLKGYLSEEIPSHTSQLTTEKMTKEELINVAKAVQSTTVYTEEDFEALALLTLSNRS